MTSAERTLAEICGITSEGIAPGASYIERACFDLLHKTLSQMSVEDLRLLIGQDICLEHTVPKAIQILKENPLVGGMHYPGDLLVNVLRLPGEFFARFPGLRDELKRLLSELPARLEQLDVIDQRHSGEAIAEALAAFQRGA